MHFSMRISGDVTQKKILFLAAVTAILISTPAMANDGFYLGVGAAYNTFLSSEINNVLDPAFGPTLRLGYNFGPIAIEGNFIGSGHDDAAPGYENGNFIGLSADLKFFLSQAHEPNQFYFLAGLGSYMLSRDDLFYGFIDNTGTGYNLGAGMERNFTEHVTLDLGAVYRFIQYDEEDILGTKTPLDPKINGNTFSLTVGLNYVF